MARDHNSAMKSELWRDIWWIKYSLIFCLLFVCFATWKYLMKLFTRGKAMCRRGESRVKDSPLTSPEPNLENEDADENVEFHDFPDYGSQFIKEKKRLQRMPSTLTHSAFSSMIRQRKNPGQIPTAPSFPAISKELMIEEAKNNPTLLTCSSNEKKNRYSSGDAGVAMKDRLSPVREGPIEDHMFPAKRTDSSTNTDSVQGLPSSPFVLHQYPRSVDGEHVSRARSFETRLRYLNTPFTVVYDCDGFNGPWIDIDEGRIEGVERCTKFIELKFPTDHGIRLLEGILERDNSSFYYLTNFEGDTYRPQNRNFMFNGDQCYNIGECRNYENDGQSEEDDPYIDDNFGDMEVLSSGGEGSVKLT